MPGSIGRIGGIGRSVGGDSVGAIRYALAAPSPASKWLLATAALSLVAATYPALAKVRAVTPPGVKATETGTYATALQNALGIADMRRRSVAKTSTVIVPSSNGYVQRSTDGGRTFGANIAVPVDVPANSLLGIANAGGDLWVAVYSNGGVGKKQIAYSTNDGLTWTVSPFVAGGSTANASTVVFGANGLFIASLFPNGSNSGAPWYKSTDGINWTNFTPPWGTSGLNAFKYTGSVWVAVVSSGQSLYYSADGVNWTAVSLGMSTGASPAAWQAYSTAGSCTQNANGQLVIGLIGISGGSYIMGAELWNDSTKTFTLLGQFNIGVNNTLYNLLYTDQGLFANYLAYYSGASSYFTTYLNLNSVTLPATSWPGYADAGLTGINSNSTSNAPALFAYSEAGRMFFVRPSAFGSSDATIEVPANAAVNVNTPSAAAQAYLKAA